MKVTKLARHSLTDKRTRQTYYKVRVYRKQNLHTLCEALTSSNKHGSIRIIVESKIVLMNNLFRNRRDLEKRVFFLIILDFLFKLPLMSFSFSTDSLGGCLGIFRQYFSLY